MRKIIDGCEYISIGEVGHMIGRSSTTIKRWYDWGKLNGYSYIRQTYGVNLPIPQYVNGTRYFRANSIEQLKQTRELMKTGIATNFFRRYRGKEGKLSLYRSLVSQNSILKSLDESLFRICLDKNVNIENIQLSILEQYQKGDKSIGEIIEKEFTQISK